MRFLSKMVAVSLSSVLFWGQGAVAALPACTTAAEKQAMVTRSFQSYLMVAAVACNQAAAYNKFISMNQSTLTSHGQALKGYFSRVYGGSSERHVNDFVTGLANAWSKVHMASMSSYCNGTWQTMWKLEKAQIKLPEIALATAAQPMPASELCTGALTAPTTATSMAQAPSPPPRR